MFKNKKVKLGLVMPPPKTEANSPRDNMLDMRNSFSNKNAALSKIQPPGPGSYDHHQFQEIGSSLRTQFQSNKKISFGSNEPRRFTLNRSLESPFVETT